MTKTRQWFPRLQTIKYLWEKFWQHRYTFGLGANRLNVCLTINISKGSHQGALWGAPEGPFEERWQFGRWNERSNGLAPIQKCNDDVKFFLRDTLWFVGFHWRVLVIECTCSYSFSFSKISPSIHQKGAPRGTPEGPLGAPFCTIFGTIEKNLKRARGRRAQNFSRQWISMHLYMENTSSILVMFIWVTKVAVRGHSWNAFYIH